MKIKLQEGDLVLCTVTKIVGTTVFVKIEGSETEKQEGTIITSEIAPGRIRNLRDYVAPNKKIVCKVLSTKDNHLHLSLRRVSSKEKKFILDKYQQEKTALSILKTVLKDKAETIANKIKQKTNLFEFLQSCKKNPKDLQAYMTKQESDKICKILSEKKEKEKQVTKIFNLSSNRPNGITIIKKILSDCKNNCEIKYLAAGKYSIKTTSENIKQADKNLSQILQKIQEQAKQNKAEFSLIEKKK